MADTAVIAIIAGATTALGVPLIAARSERARRHDAEREREMQAVRALLDEASLVLEGLLASMHKVQKEEANSLAEWGPARDAFNEQQQAAHQIAARLAILLGRRDLATGAFWEATGAIDDIEAVLSRLREVGPEETQERLEKPVETYALATVRFLDEATALAGSQALRRRRHSRVRFIREAPPPR